MISNKQTISGIYKITCQVNNKFYVGSAKDIKTRWVHHKSKLRRNKHDNSLLQRAVNKYGLNFFIFEIIEQCSIKDLLVKEQYYLDTLQPFNSKGYNISIKTINPMLGRRHTKATKQKMKEAGTDKTLHRCIDLKTMSVLYLTQTQIRKDKGIKDFHAFIHKPGHWTKKNLVSFVDIPLNGKRYKDDDIDIFLRDVKEIKRDNISNAQKGKVGTFTNKKHSEESRLKMRQAWQLRRIRSSESERRLPSVLGPL
jgi:group I intron endonuclease